MNNELDTAFATLERRLEEAEKTASEMRAAINALCIAAGLAPRYSDAGAIGHAPAGNRVTRIQDDTFYGKKQTPAMREYLEMRKSQGLGPAKPRDIYDALEAGGYQFEAKDVNVALVSMRALLRTQPNIFHRLPQGTYGLTAWYPDAKPQKSDGSNKRSKKKGASKKRAASSKIDRTAGKLRTPRKAGEKPDAAPNVVPLKDPKAA